MMTKPGITELDRCVDSRYTLVSVVAKRARMIGMERNDEDAIYDPHPEKPVSVAVKEIANGVVSYVRSDAVKKAQEYEEEKLEAISQLHEAIVEESIAENSHQQTAPVSTEAEEASEGAAPGMYDDPDFDFLEAAIREAQAAAAARGEAVDDDDTYNTESTQDTEDTKATEDTEDTEENE